MEIFKVVCLTSGSLLILALIIMVIYFICFLCRLLKLADDEITEIIQEDCDHAMKAYDDGHPDFPFKCLDCGKRL